MAQISFKGAPIHTNGNLPKINTPAPNVKFTKTDLTDISLQEFAGKYIILNIFPSLDTPTCAMTVRRFNKEAATLQNTVILCISMDLPFAQNRFCGAEGLQNVLPVSVFRHPEFADQLGVRIIDSPLSGLLARSIIVIDKNQRIIYTEQVSEITHEPNYAAVLQSLKQV